MKKLLIASVILIFCINDYALAQDETQLDKWSIDFSLNTIMGRQYDITGPVLGNLGRDSNYWNPHLNLGLRYALSPAFSVQGNLGYYRLKGDEDRHPNHPYTNNSIYLGAQGNFYFLRAFETYRQSRILNPFVYFGAGVSFSRISNLAGNRDRSLQNGFFSGGIGTLIKIPNDNFKNIDILIQYNYLSYRSEGLDGYSQFTGRHYGSRLGGFGFGISYKFSRSNRPHSDWHIGHSRIDEALRIAKSVEARQDNLERRVATVEQVQQEDHTEFRSRLDLLEQERDQMRDFDALIRSQDDMNLQIALLRERVDLLESRVPHTTIRRLHGDVRPANVEAGHYVQVYAGARHHHADGALAIIRELFEDVHGIYNLNYIIHKPHQYYVVQIGPYRQVADTDDILRMAREVFDDSFIRTYR
jgi:hypothetical protein